VSNLFINVLNMSVTASFAALIVIFVRLLLRKSPKIFSYALWSVVWFRLLCPLSFESTLSLLPVQSSMPSSIIALADPAAGLEGRGLAINQSAETVLTATNHLPEANYMGAAVNIAAAVWLVGIALILGYSIISYWKLKRRVFAATLTKDNIFETDQIQTPFVFGFFRPRIYIPAGVEEKELEYILKHEQVHIKRKDYIIKPVAFLAATLHWFNPLIWLCYFLMSKDMEMSCDEEVIRQSKEDIRKSYSRSLLSLSMKQSGFLAPLAFGESNVKARIKNILNYKKPGFWVICLACILVVAVSVVLAANPSNKSQNPSLASADKFLEYKTDYVGDASKVGNIIWLLNFPEKIEYDYFELHTDNAPYGITVHFKTDASTKDYYAAALNQAPFKKNAIIMFSLIGNAGYLNFDLNDGENSYIVKYTREQADAAIGKDVREFAVDQNKFSLLLKMLDDLEKSNFNPIVSFAWEVIDRDIEYYEEDLKVKIVDSKITRLEPTANFDDLANETIEVYALEYRLLPEDLSKVVLAGGMEVDENGWLKETNSMGSPLLVVAQGEGQMKFLGLVLTGTAVEEGGLKTAVKRLLEKNQ